MHEAQASVQRKFPVHHIRSVVSDGKLTTTAQDLGNVLLLSHSMIHGTISQMLKANFLPCVQIAAIKSKWAFSTALDDNHNERRLLIVRPIHTDDRNCVVPQALMTHGDVAE